jgi:hypothetical protein
MLNDSSQVSEASNPKPITAYEGVLSSIKTFKENRKSREAELHNMASLRSALQNTGYESARNFIADQVVLPSSDVQEDEPKRYAVQERVKAW